MLMPSSSEEDDDDYVPPKNHVNGKIPSAKKAPEQSKTDGGGTNLGVPSQNAAR
jgi:hypothetical protein